MAKQPLLGSHQRSWIWGRNLVAETLRAGRWTPYELRLADDADENLRSLADSRGVRIHDERLSRLTQLCGAADHQGVLAKMPPFPYASSTDLLNRLRTTQPPISPSPASPDPLFVITDHVQDAFNFGAIVRSAECFGVAGVLIPKARQVGVTSQVARSSAGAVNHVPIAQVDDLLALADELKRQGVRLVAASEHAATPLHAADLAGPLAIVIGNEGVGVSRELLTKCDLIVAIPLAGQVGSLNAAVAAGIVIYEATRRPA
ncbi:MAG: 23S rRNA (guanosine(2251)-2'-O)-methyltransferase RlmB [Planctomycetaceae bacterium]